MRVIAMTDGECPSCRTGLSASVSALASDSEEAIPIKTQEFAKPKDATRNRIPEETHFDIVRVLFSFCGRIPRSIYWLASILGPLSLYIFFVSARAALGERSNLLGLIALMVYLALIWMSFALSVKRLHDLNWTGWLILFALIPGLGQIFILCTAGMMRGTRGPNRYGADPLELLK